MLNPLKSPDMNILIISASHNPNSKSFILSEAALDYFKTQSINAKLIDMREWPIPFCDGSSAYGDEKVQTLNKQIESADGIIMATPIYNYDTNAVAKNLIELTGRAWTNKVVGFLCAAGGKGSYMSVMSIANSLMLDFRCVILPRFVYATGSDFENNAVHTPEIEERLKDFCLTFQKYVEAIGKIDL